MKRFASAAAERIGKDLERWNKVVAEAGIKPE